MTHPATVQQIYISSGPDSGPLPQDEEALPSPAAPTAAQISSDTDRVRDRLACGRLTTFAPFDVERLGEVLDLADGHKPVYQTEDLPIRAGKVRGGQVPDPVGSELSTWGENPALLSLSGQGATVSQILEAIRGDGIESSMGVSIGQDRAIISAFEGEHVVFLITCRIY